MTFSAILFVLLCLSFVAQEFLPAIEWAYGARLFIVPVVFFCSAVSVPFPVMLMFAFFTGFVWDARHLILVEEVAKSPRFSEMLSANPTFGYSIFLYGLMGALMQGIRPFFRRGRWELPVLMTGVVTALMLTLEYLWISFLRGNFEFHRQIWVTIGASAIFSMIASTVMFIFITWLSKASGYQIRYEGLNMKRSW